MFTKKSLCLLILVSIITIQNYSQSPLKKGVYALSGSIEGSYDKGEWENNTDETYIVNVKPAIGYFFTDNIMVNGELSFNYYEDKYTSSTGRSSTYIYRSLSLGPSARYYFNSTGIIPFLGLSLTYLKSLGEDDYGIKYGIQGGINYFVSNSVALEPFLAYSISKYYSPDQTQKDFSLGIRVAYYIIK